MGGSDIQMRPVPARDDLILLLLLLNLLLMLLLLQVLLLENAGVAVAKNHNRGACG